MKHFSWDGIFQRKDGLQWLSNKSATVDTYAQWYCIPNISSVSPTVIDLLCRKGSADKLMVFLDVWSNGMPYQILVLQLCSALDKGEIICPHYLLVYIFRNNLNFAICGLLYERKPPITHCPWIANASSCNPFSF